MSHPLLYQINTRVLLQERGVALGRPATLDDVPDAFLDDIAAKGFEWVWPLGVWQTGPTGRQISRSTPKLQEECRQVLPDLPPRGRLRLAVRDHGLPVHTDFGGDAALAPLRERLARRGLKLLLDFVPNHTAPDHPWVTEHPEYYIDGSEEDLPREPQNYARVEPARGDAPAGSWPTAAIRTSTGGRTRSSSTIATPGCARRRSASWAPSPSAATACAATWRCCCSRRSSSGPGATGRRPSDGSPPKDNPFWPEAIAAIRRRHPSSCSSPRSTGTWSGSCSRPASTTPTTSGSTTGWSRATATPVREHLRADARLPGPLDALPREPRRAARGGHVPAAGMHKAAAIVDLRGARAALLLRGPARGAPGARLDAPRAPAGRAGRRRAPRLLRPPAPLPHRARGARREWRLCRCRPAWDGNTSNAQLIASSWQAGERRLLVTVNYGPSQAQGLRRRGHGRAAGKRFTLVDQLSDTRFDRTGDDLANEQLYVDMAPWSYNIFELKPI